MVCISSDCSLDWSAHQVCITFRSVPDRKIRSVAPGSLSMKLGHCCCKTMINLPQSLSEGKVLVLVTRYVRPTPFSPLTGLTPNRATDCHGSHGSVSKELYAKRGRARPINSPPPPPLLPQQRPAPAIPADGEMPAASGNYHVSKDHLSDRSC